MSRGLILSVTVIYVFCAINELWNGKAPSALTLAGYAIANLGLIWMMQTA